MKPFSPAYLAGFYADTSDVGSDIYNQSVEKEVNDRTVKQINSQFPGASIDYPSDKSAAFGTKINKVSSAMFPVWFLTWRMDSRVAYAVINGETGKISTDIPVDRKKYLLGSLLLAIPIFFILLLLPTIKATSLLTITSIVSLFTIIMYYLNSNEMYRREERLDDLGYQSYLMRQGEVPPENPGKPKEDPEKKKLLRRSRWLEIGPAIIATIFAVVVRFLLKPVSDIPYYGCAILVMVCICWSFFGLLKKYNLLTTRPLPEFHDRKGGEDYGS